MFQRGFFTKKKAFRITSYASFIILLCVAPLFLGSYHIHLAILVLIYIILTSSLRTIYISGQLSLGHAAFVGIGAYTSAILALRLDWTPWCTVLLGGLASMVAGILIGLPFSRLRAMYFTMASLFLGIMITSLIAVFPELTQSYTGLMSIPRLFGFPKEPYYYFFLALALVSLLVLYQIEHSRVGMTFKAVAQSHLAAASIGISETRTRILALGIGCFFAGIAGAGYAHYSTFIAPTDFALMPSIYLLVYLIVGGTGSFAGPIVGAIVLVLIPYLMGGFKGFAPFFLAGALIIVIFLIPQGLISLPSRTKLWIRKLRQGRLSESAP